MLSITSFNVAHLHLLLNHVPTIGTTVALGLIIVAYMRRDDRLKLVGLELVFLIALLALPAFMTGVAAFQKLRDQPGIADQAVRLHEDVAIYGFTWLEFAGFIGWVALWQARRRGRVPAGMVAAATALTAISLLVMARAANIGGDIRHPELGGIATAIAPADFLSAKIHDVMVNSPWVWPASESVHFLGLSLSFGVLMAVNLRILGVMKQVPFVEVHRLLPWGMLGFGANLITGMLFFIGQPGQYSDSAPFYWKVVFLMIAGANFLYLTVFRKAWPLEGTALEANWTPTPADKAMAVVSLVSWLVVLYTGRMLPFIGHSF